jgi:hypothetical protein
MRDVARYEARQEFAQFQAEAERQKRVVEIQAREDAARVKYPDYNTVVTRENLAPILQANPGVIEFLATNEHGPDLAHYLGSHPDETLAIARMQPFEAALRLGQLVHGFSTPQAPQSAPKPSRAPAPISPIKGAGAAPAVTVSQRLTELEEAGNYDEWRKLKKSTR